LDGQSSLFLESSRGLAKLLQFIKGKNFGAIKSIIAKGRAIERQRGEGGILVTQEGVNFSRMRACSLLGGLGQNGRLRGKLVDVIIIGLVGAKLVNFSPVALGLGFRELFLHVGGLLLDKIASGFDTKTSALSGVARLAQTVLTSWGITLALSKVTALLFAGLFILLLVSPPPPTGAAGVAVE